MNTKTEDRIVMASRNERHRTAFVILLMVFGIGLTTGAGTKIVRAQKDSSVLKHDLTVSRKLIQVSVKDRDGKPVTDLAREDFELFDQGLKAEITDFEKYIRKEGSPENAKQAGETSGRAPSVARNYFLFFDFSNNDAESIKEAKQAALDFIDGDLDVSDRIGVLSYSPIKMLAIHQFLTADRQAVRAALERMKSSEETFGAANNDETRKLELDAIAKNEGEGLDMMFDSAGFYADEKFDLEMRRTDKEIQARLFADTLRDLAKALNRVPGKKNILFFSSGIPSSLFRGVYSANQKRLEPQTNQIINGIPKTDGVLTDKYDRMIRELDAADCSIFSIYSMNDKKDKMATVSPQLANQTLGEASLQKLSEETGGRFYNSVEGTGAIMKSIGDITGSYYVLGYSVKDEKDGKYHEIKVNVKRDGCSASVQSGYFADKPFAKYSNVEKELHFQDLVFSHDPEIRYEFPFSIQARSCLYETETGYLLFSRFPADGMKNMKGKIVEIAEIITDDAGVVKWSGRGAYNLKSAPKKDIFYVQSRPLTPGRYRARLVMRNRETGAASRAETAFEVPVISNSGVSVLKPFLLKPAEGAFYLKGIGSSGNTLEANLLARVFPWLSKEMIPADPPYRFGHSRIHVFFQCQIRENITDLTVDLSLKPQTSEIPIKPRCKLQHAKTGPDILSFLAEMDLQPVPSGAYTLDIAIIDKGTGKAWRNSVPIKIE